MTSGGWIGPQGTPASRIGERGLIARIADLIAAEIERQGVSSPGVLLGLGDDAAVLHPTAGYETLLTCDAQVEGRHFLKNWITPRQLGARCASVNLSDIAAMGGIPRAALLSLCLSPDSAMEDIEDIYRGMVGRLAEFGVLLIGGNIAGLTSGLILDMTLSGEIERSRLIRRDQSRPGDLVWVTGYPGSSAAGREILTQGGREMADPGFRRLIDAYLSPTPRVREGQALAATRSVSSMIDISDGLLGDLCHLIEDREVGIRIEVASVPVDESMTRAAREAGSSPEIFFFAPSDDYELLFTAPPADADRVIDSLSAETDLPVNRIGIVTGDTPGEVVLVDPDGHCRLAPEGGGWDHLA